MDDQQEPFDGKHLVFVGGERVAHVETATAKLWIQGALSRDLAELGFSSPGELLALLDGLRAQGLADMSLARLLDLGRRSGGLKECAREPVAAKA